MYYPGALSQGREHLEERVESPVPPPHPCTFLITTPPLQGSLAPRVNKLHRVVGGVTEHAATYLQHLRMLEVREVATSVCPRASFYRGLQDLERSCSRSHSGCAEVTDEPPRLLNVCTSGRCLQPQQKPEPFLTQNKQTRLH